MQKVSFQTMCLTVLATVLLGEHSAWALAMGPGLFKIQNVTPGVSVDVRKTSGVAFTLKNDSDIEGTYMLVCKKPSDGGVAQWEAGYDEIPDPAWCKLEKNEIVVPAKSNVEVGLIVDIPDKPENYNCKWMLAVVLSGSPGQGKVGVGLAIAARVQIETLSSDEKSGGAASISTVPSVLSVEGKPGSSFERAVAIQNNTPRVLECVTERIAQVYATEEMKWPRYPSRGFKPLEKETWLLKEKEQKFTLKPGEKLAYKLAGKIPDTAKPGEKWEELVFITAAPAEPGAKGPAGRETRTFFRVQMQIAEEKK